jgi:hypothetical protein
MWGSPAGVSYTAFLWWPGRTYQILIDVTLNAGTFYGPYDGAGFNMELHFDGVGGFRRSVYVVDSPTNYLTMYQPDNFDGSVNSLSIKEILMP